jgi:hypothetical protein
MAFAEQRGPHSSPAAASLWAAAACAWLCSGSALASAQDEPLLSAPSEFTDVMDGFDGADPLDIQARIEFRSTFSSGTVQREVIDDTTDDASNEGRYRDVLDHSGVRNELQLGLEIGVWRDLMVFVGLPIVLSDDQELSLPDSGTCDDDAEGSACSILEELPNDALPDMNQEQPLFEVNPRVVSEQRSGLPRVELGVAFGLFNQYRGDDATWVLRAAFALPTGGTKTACTVGVKCTPGLSDGSLWLTLESRWSRRYRYVEPLLGISHRFGWVTLGEKAFSSQISRGADSLPTTTEASAGAAIVPWEDRMRHQRFSIEILGRAAYISKGRGMSVLFDALGTSMHSQLNPDLDEAAEEGRFTGVTTIGAHGRLGVDLMLVMKAARYVRFSLGTELGVLTDHLLTGAEDCSASDSRDETTMFASPCAATRISPLYRPVIDAPGQRFRLTDAMTVGLIARAQGQF